MKKTAIPKAGKPVTLGSVKLYSTGSAFTLAWYAGGERKREKRNTLDSAQARAREINADLSNGSAHVRSFTAKQSAVIDTSIDLLREINVPLSTAVREYCEAFKILGGKASIAEAARKYFDDRKKQSLEPIKFGAACTLFNERNVTQGLSEAYRTSITKFLKRMAPALGASFIGDITNREIAAAVESTVTGGPRAFNNVLGAVSAVFAFARKQGYLPRLEKTEAELVERKEARSAETIAVYSSAELRTLLTSIPIEFVPFVALGALAGVRTSEIFRMEWRQIDLSKGYILLDRGFTKTKRRRVIPICEGLRSWIEPLHGGTGKIYNYSSSKKLGEAILEAWPETVEKRRNALRHSFGTYRFALLQDEMKVSAEMGNSPQELREHYAELATPSEGEEFFSVSRKGPKNISSFEQEAA